MLAIVRVVGRLVHHGEDLARSHVDDYSRPCGRALIADSGFQLAVSEVLNAQVDRQHQVTARPRGSDAVDILNNVPVAILNDALRAIFARQPMVKCELQPFLARIVNVSESEDVSSDFSRGIVTAVFPREVHAGNSERLDPLRFGRLTATSEVEKLTVEVAGDAARQVLPIQLQR